MGIPALPPPQSKSNQAVQPPPVLVNLLGQGGAQNRPYLGNPSGTLVSQPGGRVGMVRTPQPWDHMGQVSTPLPLLYQTGTPPPLHPWSQVGQAGTATQLRCQAGTPPPLHPWSQVGQAGTATQLRCQAGTPPLQPWSQVGQAGIEPLQPRSQTGQVNTSLLLGHQVGTPPLQHFGPIGTPIHHGYQAPQPRDQFGPQLQLGHLIGCPSLQPRGQIGAPIQHGYRAPQLTDQVGTPPLQPFGLDSTLCEEGTTLHQQEEQDTIKEGTGEPQKHDAKEDHPASKSKNTQHKNSQRLLTFQNKVVLEKGLPKSRIQKEHEQGLGRTPIYIGAPIHHGYQAPQPRNQVGTQFPQPLDNKDFQVIGNTWFKGQDVKYVNNSVIFGTLPPRLGDQLGYICVTNDSGQKIRHLPLNPDYSLSTSTLREFFPDATGLYYYSTDNLLLGVLQVEDKLFPPCSRDGFVYITKKKLVTSAGNHFKVKDEYPSSSLLVPKKSCACSELKTQVDLMTVAIRELRTEIFELKSRQNTTYNGSEFDVLDSELNINANIFKSELNVNSNIFKPELDVNANIFKSELNVNDNIFKPELDVNANIFKPELDVNDNIFKPALTLSDKEALKNYQAKRLGKVDRNEVYLKMEEGVEVKDDEVIDENENIRKLDKHVDVTLVQEMEKCAGMKKVELIDENLEIQMMEKCVEFKKIEMKDENEYIEEINRSMKMKNAELIDLVPDKCPSSAKETSRVPSVPIINTRTASWVLNLPNDPLESEKEIPPKVNSIVSSKDPLEPEKEIHPKVKSIVSSKAKLVRRKSIDHSVQGDKIESNEKALSILSEGRNVVASNEIDASNTDNQLETEEDPFCDKPKKLLTFRPKLCSKKTDKKSSNQLVNSKVKERGGIYDSDESDKNRQSGSDGKSHSMPVSDQAPLRAKESINQMKKTSTSSSKHPTIATFHLQSGSSFDLNEKIIHDFFSTNYGEVKSAKYDSSSGKGMVYFASETTKEIFNKEIEIGDCVVYTSRRLQDLTEESVKTQILLESRNLPIGWDRSIILRKHFEKFGKVLGVVFIRNRGEFKRSIVGFQDEKVADMLVGFIEVINGVRVMIQRVNAKTI